MHIPKSGWETVKNDSETTQEKGKELVRLKNVKNGALITVSRMVTKEMPGLVNPEVFANEILSDDKLSYDEFRVIWRDTIVTNKGLVGNTVLAEGATHSMRKYLFYGFFIDENSFFSISCSAGQKEFNEMKEDFRNIMTSFDFEKKDAIQATGK